MGTFPTSKTAQKFKFRISKFGICHKIKRKYTFKCKVTDCLVHVGLQKLSLVTPFEYACMYTKINVNLKVTEKGIALKHLVFLKECRTDNQIIFN